MKFPPHLKRVDTLPCEMLNFQNMHRPNHGNGKLSTQELKVVDELVQRLSTNLSFNAPSSTSWCRADHFLSLSWSKLFSRDVWLKQTVIRDLAAQNSCWFNLIHVIFIWFTDKILFTLITQAQLRNLANHIPRHKHISNINKTEYNNLHGASKMFRHCGHPQVQHTNHFHVFGRYTFQEIYNWILMHLIIFVTALPCKHWSSVK